jgi:tetratricopeptide (TPR) repeat protein
MANEELQSLESIGPVQSCEHTAGGGIENESEAKRDYRQGREALDKQDLTQAVICFHNALKGFEEDQDQQGVANASDRLGDTCMAREEFGMAVDHYQRALTICRQLDDSFSQAAVQRKLVACHRKLGEYDQALSTLFDLTEHYRLLRNPKGTVEVLIVIAETYVEMGKHDLAADTYRTVASIHQNFKHSRLAAEFSQRADQLAGV